MQDKCTRYNFTETMHIFIYRTTAELQFRYVEKSKDK